MSRQVQSPAATGIYGKSGLISQASGHKGGVVYGARSLPGSRPGCEQARSYSWRLLQGSQSERSSSLQVNISAEVSKVTVKPPKAVQGVRLGPALVQIVLEIEGVDQIESLARFVNQTVDVSLDSLQTSLDDVAAAASKALSGNGVTATVTYNRTLGE